MIYRIFPTKDTWITDIGQTVTPYPTSGSNFGASEILNVFKTGVSGTVSLPGQTAQGRILMQFDHTQLPSGSGQSYYLKLFDARHAETLPASYDLSVHRMLVDWDEGGGLDEETFQDLGIANWILRKSNQYWNAPGGELALDFASIETDHFHFDNGHESPTFNVTSLVNAWNAGTPDNGVMVKVSATLEADKFDYYVKKFHARETNFLDRRPYIEARWDDSIQDDRSNFVFDYSGTLYLYNEVRGQLVNIPGVIAGPNCLTVRIEDQSGSLLTVSGSWTGRPGIYSASFLLPTGSYSGSLFKDIWYLNQKSYMTGNFVPTDNFSQPSLSTGRYEVQMPNLKVEYTVDETPELRVGVYPYDFNPPVVNTGSITNAGIIINRGYYRIDNDRTKEQVVPFGTGSYQGGTDWTRLSYDGNGNYFDFQMGALAPGQVYRVVFLFDQDGRKQIVDNGFKFRIV